MSKLMAVLGALVAFGSLSIDMYLPAFKSIGEAFGVPQDLVELSLSSFFVGLTLGQLFYGPLADRFGRKAPLYCGLVLYTLMSLACALAPSIEVLIGLRFFQAVGGCAGIVIARTIVRDIFTPQECARAFSLLLLVMGAAPILAPLLGGYINAWMGWRAIFLFKSLFGFICLVAAYRMLPPTRAGNRALNFKGMIVSYRHVMGDGNFMRYALAGGLAQAGMFAYITGSSYVFTELFHVSSETYAMIFGINGAGLILASQVNARLLRVLAWKTILPYAFALLSVAAAFLVGVGLLGLGFWPLASALFFYVALLGFTYPNTSAGALLGQAEQAGVASALLGSMQFGIACLVSLAVSHFHNATTLPMTLTMGACGLLAVASFLALRKGSSKA